MRLPLYGLLLAAIPILIGHGISQAANEQNTPAPGLSPQAIAQYRSMLKGFSPETVDSLMTEALTLIQTYAGASPGSAEWQELKRHKAEFEEMKGRLCQVLIKC
jgi:hypothetical protein